MATKKVLIVGAGPGGLSAGMILAHQGLQVTIVEKEERVGGRNATLRIGDFLHDVGPTFLLMPKVLRDTFTLAGKNVDNYLKLTALDPMYRLYLPNTTLNVSSNPTTMRAEIAQKFPGEEAGFDRFLRDEKKRFDAMYPCLTVPYESFWSLFSKNLRHAIPYLSLGKKVADILPRYAKNEELRLMYSFQTKYLGMSPWDCPAAFMMLPYIEHAFGIDHVEGGLSRISEAMAKAVQEDGGIIRTQSPVAKVIVENGRTVGVTLQNGEELRADYVILNADFAYAMTHLFEPGTLKKYTPKKMSQMKYSCSTFMLYLNVDTVYTDIAHHNIVFAENYKQNLDDIFTKKVLPQGDISFYVRNSSVIDKTVAPHGNSQLYVLVPVPNNESGIDWQAVAPAFREHILNRIGVRLGLSDLRAHIIDERTITPYDWEQSYNVYRGATFNLAHSLDQMLYFRPHNTFEELAGCYIVGGGTHPGSGLPTIYESGRIAAEKIIADAL